jgi:glyoxylase-like metal-dependent hydrolase (beta-lactamase superfamily II)
MNNSLDIQTLDLKFQNCNNAIASYLIPHSEGIILIESGPGSTQEQLKINLQEHGYELKDVSHVLLTHIHLDHAGASGWLAKHGANIYVHERGAAHMLDPSKLIASATRIYQDKMKDLWGEFLPVPDSRLTALSDNDEIQIGSFIFRALDTPGHANHHMAYMLDDLCFSGDVGGVRIKSIGPKHLRVPMPPPEFNPLKWRQSISRLKKERIRIIAPTHFGMFEDVSWHLDTLLYELDSAEEWMRKVMPLDLEIADLRDEFKAWAMDRSVKLGVDPTSLDAFEKANPSGMSADGIKRYWEKYILNT